MSKPLPLIEIWSYQVSYWHRNQHDYERLYGVAAAADLQQWLVADIRWRATESP